MQDNNQIKNLSVISEDDSPVNLKDILSTYLSYWKWFALSCIICVLGAFLYLRYNTPLYSISTTILIKDDKKGGGLASELNAFSDLGLLSQVKSNVDNEIEVLHARTLVRNTVKELKLNIAYYLPGRVRSLEAYKTSPINVTFLDETDNLESSKSFVVKIISAVQYELYDVEENKIGSCKFGEAVKNKLGNFIITTNMMIIERSPDLLNGSEVVVEVRGLTGLANSFRGRLAIEPINAKSSSILMLSIVDPLKEKGVDFLNMLVQKYNEEAIKDKNLVATNTEKFINKRIDSITKELNIVETGVEVFKRQNRLTDISTDAQLFVSSASEYENNVIQTATKLKVVDAMLALIQKADIVDVIPTNLIPDNEAGTLISRYNELVMDRNRIAPGMSATNPLLLDYTRQVEGLRYNIVENLKNIKSSLLISQKDLKRQESVLGGKIGQVPQQEREFRSISRQQTIKETLYLYLLQKREENAITLAVTAPNSKVIDSAYANPGPISPKTNVIVLGAFLLGLFIPFAIIFLLKLLDSKIHGQSDLKGLGIPFLGDVPNQKPIKNLLTSTAGQAPQSRLES